MITSQCSQPTRLTVLLLERNLESVLVAIRDCGEKEQSLLEAALAKNLNARDTLFGRIAHDPGRRSIRDCVRKKAWFDRAVVAIRNAMP